MEVTIGVDSSSSPDLRLITDYSEYSCTVEVLYVRSYLLCGGFYWSYLVNEQLGWEVCYVCTLVVLGRKAMELVTLF